MQRENPTYSTAWIGNPPDEKGVPGHDKKGLLQMAKANTTNPLFFWCLNSYVPHYKKVFESYPHVKVMSIEKFLNFFPPESPMGKRAKIVKKMKKILLDDPARNKTIDRMVFKDLFFLFLLYAFGGWMGDSNLKPLLGKTVKLPPLDKIHMPYISEEKTSDIRIENLEAWLLFSPKPLDKTAKKLFDQYVWYFFEREKVFQQEGYSKKYYSIGIDPFFLPALALIKKGKINVFQCKLSRPNESELHADISQFNLIKEYFNTHKFENREWDDKSESKKMSLAVGFFDVNRAMAPEKIVQILYRFSAIYKKNHPEESKMMDLFKKQVMEDYRKINFTPDNTPEYIVRRENFLTQYSIKKMHELYKDFCIKASKLDKNNILSV